ncbi:hypothetical protein E4U23_000327, partial [Claviceps purpurea]
VEGAARRRKGVVAGASSAEVEGVVARNEEIAALVHAVTHGPPSPLVRPTLLVTGVARR